ncbi:hypothetical protein ACQCVH_00405 [Bacillus infantis]|uniref:hypothetical protein n=1 Tax=Bacillus infantis TaxID=324767 RepID=UPI003CF9E6C8
MAYLFDKTIFLFFQNGSNCHQSVKSLFIGVQGTQTPHKMHAHFSRAMKIQGRVFNVLRECSGNAETPQARSDEEAQRRPAESEVPGTEMNPLSYRPPL